MSHFISCDWGTSNFRLKLVELDSLTVLDQKETGEGILSSFRKGRNADHRQYLLNYLVTQADELLAGRPTCSIVGSGMITSSLGIIEIPYKKMPFKRDGSDLKTDKIHVENKYEIFLISGVCTANDIMRGEETQAIGMNRYMEDCERGTFILPGTHSKHLSFSQDSFTGLKSFMTGELFQLLSQQSILAESIGGDEMEEPSMSFDKGVDLGKDRTVLGHLFSIRARHILGGSTPTENRDFLSGLLIGAELSYLQDQTETIYLAAPKPLSWFYERALCHLIGTDRLVVIDSKNLDKAIIEAHSEILKRNAER